MPTSAPTYSKAAAPWRRSEAPTADNATVDNAEIPEPVAVSKAPFSAQAKEFVPSFGKKPEFNTEATEFVPRFNMQASEFVPNFVSAAPTPAPQPARNTCQAFICLDGYSDDSSDEEDNFPAATKPATPPAAKPAPVVQKPASIQRDSKDEPSKLLAENVAAKQAEPAKAKSPWNMEKVAPWKRPQRLNDEDEEETSALQPTLSNITMSTQADTQSSLTSASSQSVLSDPESAGEEEKVVEVVDGQAQAFDMSVKDLLKLRHSIEWIEGIKEGMTAQEVSPAKVAEPVEKAAAVEKPRAIRPKPVAEKSWRDRDEKPVRTKTCPGDAFAAVRAEATEDHAKLLGRLEASDNSFVARQKMRRNTVGDIVTDEEVVRTMKAILNKLTIEKFPQLTRKLVTCGIRTTSHLETLIHEVFEKATTQHHFINMYADLCVVLQKHFSENPVTDDPKMNFKKVLLNACQASFERHLTPPGGLDRLDDEDRQAAELRYKMRMLGNIRFIGALLVRKMLATKVMFAIMEELLSEPTPEALESLASLLNVVGPAFDIPDWPHRMLLNAIFAQVNGLVKQPALKARVRCLLKDVLDTRAAGWEDKKPRQMEAPTSISAVHEKAWAEESAAAGGYASGNKFSPNNSWESTDTPKPNNSWDAKSAKSAPLNINRLAGDLFGSGPKTPIKGSAPEELQPSIVPSEGPKKRLEKASPERFDKEACRKEVSAVLCELRLSHDVKEAIIRTAGIAVPLTQQPEQLCDVLGQVVEEGSAEVRKIGFQFVAGLFIEGHWKPGALGKGLQSFVEDTCADLKCDVPILPMIVHEELYNAFAPLMKNGLLQSAHYDLLKAEF